VEHEAPREAAAAAAEGIGYLTDKELLRKLLADSISTFWRALPSCVDAARPGSKNAQARVVAQAATFFRIDPAPFERLARFAGREDKEKDLDPTVILGSYLKEISCHRCMDASKSETTMKILLVVVGLSSWPD